jgi:hypothetical protein
MIFVIKRALILTIAMIIFSARAAAADWPRLPDGRAQIEIKDVKLALPVTGALHGITFSLLDAFGKPGSMSFKDVVEKPDEARARLRDAKSVLVSIPNISDRKDLFLGKFERGAPMPDAFSVEIGEVLDVNCLAEAEDLNRLRAKIGSGEAKPGEDGWVEFRSEKAPRTYTYFRKNHGEGLPEHFDSIRCNYHTACMATSCVKPNVAFVYRFNRDVLKRDQWHAMIARAAEVMRYLFVKAAH